MKKIISILITLSMAYAHSSYAQGETVQDIDDVIVLSDRLQIPFKKQNRNIQVLSRDEIQKIPAKSVIELLSFIAGVDVRQRGPNGAQADIGIDGGTFDQTLILLNGVKMSDPQTGHNMMNLPVTIDAIERIEILKGAAARIYGVNALMGVINIVTKSADNDEITARAYAGSSFRQDDSTDHMYLNYGLTATALLHSGKTQHLLTAGYDRGNGYRYNTAYENIKLMYHADASLNERISLSVAGGFVNNDFGANLFYAAPRDKEAEEQVQMAYGSIRLGMKIRDNWTLRPYASYKFLKDHYVFIRQDPSVFENVHNNNVVDAGLDNMIYTSFGNIALGLNFRNEAINSTNLGQRNRSNIGLFAEYQKTFLQRLDLNAGLYANQNSVFGWNVYPGVDLGYNIGQNWRLYANAGMGQRLPTFTDLYYSGPNNLGNASLVPEWLVSYELGTKYNKNSFYVNTTLFYKDGREFIDWIRADTTQPWQVQNFATMRTFGWHLDARYSWQVSNTFLLDFFTSYTYLNPKIGKPSDETQSHYLSQYAVNSLQHQWVLRLNAKIAERWSFALGNRLVKRINSPDAEGYKRTSYNLTDVRLAYDFSRVSIYADVNNVLDIQYIESGVVPLPGRWVTIGCVVDFIKK